jgi:putative oxidoreductase
MTFREEIKRKDRRMLSQLDCIFSLLDPIKHFLVDISHRYEILVLCPTNKLQNGGKTVFISQDRQTNSGLLVMRLGLAAVLLIHSLPKLFAGSSSWQSVGTTLGFINVGVPVAILGFVMLLLEALGAISLVFGYFFRIACIILFIIFGLYFFNYFRIGYQTLMLWSAGLAAVFFGLVYVGPGRYTIAVKLEKK